MKDNIIKVRVTEKQKKELDEAAIKNDIKLSEEIRNRLFQKTISNDPYLLLTKLRIKYQEERENTRNAFDSVKIGNKIKTLDEIIIDIASLN